MTDDLRDALDTLAQEWAASPWESTDFVPFPVWLAPHIERALRKSLLEMGGFGHVLSAKVELKVLECEAVFIAALRETDQ